MGCSELGESVNERVVDIVVMKSNLQIESYAQFLLTC
jgi:hypothetical protein